MFKSIILGWKSLTLALISADASNSLVLEEGLALFENQAPNRDSHFSVKAYAFGSPPYAPPEQVSVR